MMAEPSAMLRVGSGHFRAASGKRRPIEAGFLKT
jgi:hypothetical protein